MKIYLASLGVDASYSRRLEVTRLAALSKSTRHCLVDEPEVADAVLYTESTQIGDPVLPPWLWSSAEFRTHRQKAYVLEERDQTYCYCPGLYSSVPSTQLRRPYQVPWSYLSTWDATSTYPDLFRGGGARDLLCSFVGNLDSHPSRRALVALRRGDVIVEDRGQFFPWNMSAVEEEAGRRHYAGILSRSNFVLCPRGQGTSSFRFYEALAAGRVPVVLSDEWVPPVGLGDGEVFVRWPEGRTGQLVAYLERLAPRSRELGANARRAFERLFADDVMFTRLGDALEALAATAPWDTFPRWGFPTLDTAKRLTRRARAFAKRSGP